MPGLFSKVFKGRDAASKKLGKEAGAGLDPQQPRWEGDVWQRKNVEPEEIQELMSGCTAEIKSRALDVPFLLLPFRPASDPSAARTFVRNFFGSSSAGSQSMTGERLSTELRLAEPLVLCSVMKWCWSRLAGGVVTWEAYELFKIGEQDSNNARDAFATFLPISVASDARTKIIFDFFSLMAAVAAHGKTNGLGGRKLSRYAGWWAFDHADSGNGFDGGYKSWSSAADATSHLFFAYLRTLTSDSTPGKSGILALPRSLQALLESTEYPPVQQPSLQTSISKVAMIVDSVSPTPFALLRRAKNFEYRAEDEALQRFSEYEDPVQALTDECRRVLTGISSANDSSTSKMSTSLRDASWSRFEDIGFGSLGDLSDREDGVDDGSPLGRKPQHPSPAVLRNTPQSNIDVGRPTTPSWADFLSTGFVDESKQNSSLLPPGKQLPPINALRGHSSQSHKRVPADDGLEPGELASIRVIDLDDAFWWVWITSLAGEETVSRKATFGRCALIETKLNGGKWLVIEEVVKGAMTETNTGAYYAEKKSRFHTFKMRSGLGATLGRSKSSAKVALMRADGSRQRNVSSPVPSTKTSFSSHQHAKIQAAAAVLQQKQLVQEADSPSVRRAREAEADKTKTNSVFTLQPVIITEAAPAMQWASSYDKSAIRAQYLGDQFAGTGSNSDLTGDRSSNGEGSNASGPGTPYPPPPRKSDSLVQQGEPKGLPARDPALRKPLDGRAVSGQRKISQSQEMPPGPRREASSTQQDVHIRTDDAPSPPVPAVDSGVANETVAEVATCAVPAAQHGERSYPRPMERVQPMEQPITPVKDPHQFASGPEYSSHPALNETAEYFAGPDSPENNRTRKKGGQSGFKGFFGRKKVEGTARPPPYTSTSSSSAVAAARAALEAKAQQNLSAAPQPIKATRRVSGFGAKKAQEPSNGVLGSTKALWMPMMGEAPPMSTAPGVEPPKAPYPQEEKNGASYASAGNAGTVDERQAEHEVRPFDHGPLTEAPAYVPDDSRSASMTQYEPAYSEVGAPVSERSLSGEATFSSGEGDDVSEASVDLTRQISPVQDRWAQIRKNAAERAATRMSEEQSRQTVQSDDGETSGEETIEARVARIKARVAELTGGSMDASGARR